MELSFISSMTEHSAWPLTCLVVVFLFRKQLIELFSRLASIKHRDTEFRFSDGSKTLIENGSVSPEVREKIQRHQVITDQVLGANGYKLYSNGLLVQRVRVKVQANQSETNVPFPVAFPNEVTNIQFVGREPLAVKAITIGSLCISHSSSHEDRQVDLIISGL